MDIEILYGPSSAMGVLKLDANEEVQVECGAMVSMSQGVVLKEQDVTGVTHSMGRALRGGVGFYQNIYQAPSSGGEVIVAPPLPGDMRVFTLEDESLMVQSGCYMASGIGVDMSTRWSGAKKFFATEGLLMLRAIGSGPVLIASYGAIHEKVLARDESYIIDTGHLVAFTEDMSFHVRMLGGVKSSMFSGEGVMVEMTGPGRLLMQARSTDAFLSWMVPLMRRP